MTWEQRHHALTHILTHPPTTTPSLHSQFFISTQIPSTYLHFHSNSDYPPLFNHQFRWAFRLFLRRVSRLEASWRAKCPYQQPPPLVLAKGVQPPKWGDEDKREYVKKRLRRKRSPVEMSCMSVESMFPFHTATASALLTSMLSAAPRTCGWTLEDLNDDV